MIACELGTVRAWFTDRWGGVSIPPYESANLADHVGDVATDVVENRRALAVRLAAADDVVPRDPKAWQWLTQVHGRDVIASEATDLADVSVTVAPTGDGAVTALVGRPLVVMAADCAPLVLAAEGAVAVVHAGWPGLESGVIEAGVEALRARTRAPVRAVLGPCIRPARYEFGPDLLRRIVNRLGPEVASRTATGAPALDIPAGVRAALGRVGVDRLDDVGICTAASADHFSHRRDGTTGRHGVVAVRT